MLTFYWTNQTKDDRHFYHDYNEHQITDVSINFLYSPVSGTEWTLGS